MTQSCGASMPSNTLSQRFAHGKQKGLTLAAGGDRRRGQSAGHTPGFDQAVNLVSRIGQQVPSLVELIVHPIQQLVVVAQRVSDLDRQLQRRRRQQRSAGSGERRGGLRRAVSARDGGSSPPSARARDR